MKEQDNFTNNFVNQNNIASLSLPNKSNDNQLSNNNFQLNNFNQNQQNFISNLNINNIVSLNQNENNNKNSLPIHYINNFNENSNIKNTNEFQLFENINQNIKKDNNQIQSEIINFNQKSIFNNYNNNFFNNNIINNFYMGGNNIKQGAKPYLTKKHSLLNAHSLNAINEDINKDILQLEKFLPNFKQYVTNNNLDPINICIKYIDYTNFFFNEDATKKVNDLLQKIIVSDNYNNYGNVNNQYNEINQIQEKIKELYKKIIPYDIRVNYLKTFYDKNPEKTLVNLFRNDLNKYQKYYEKKYYLYEIFEIVKQKMNNKDKEEIKNLFNRIFFNSKSQSNNYNNNNNASLGYNGSNNNNGGNYQNNYNHHHNSIHQYRKYSYQSPGDQIKTNNSNSNYNTHDNNYNNGNGSHYRHMNYNNNNRNNNYLNEDDLYNDNLGYKNNYDHHHNSSYQRNNNNYKSSYSSRHYYNNMNSKNANNRNKGNRKNSTYSGVLVEIDSSPKKMVNQNSDGNENKEEEKNIINNDNNIINQNQNNESEEEIKNGNENHENNLKNEESNDNNIINNIDQLDLENNLNINKENSKKENFHIIDDDNNRSEDNINLKDENILNDFNLINPFQENTTSEENSERGDSSKNNILKNPHNDSDIIKMNINDNLNEKENKNNEENNNDNNNKKEKEQEQENDLILNIINSNENNIIGSTLYENNPNNFNNIVENNQYHYDINEEEDKKILDKKDEDENDKNKSEIKSSDIRPKDDSVPRYNSDNNINNKNNAKIIYNYNQNNNFIGNNIGHKNISNNQNSNNLYNNNLQNNFTKEQQQQLKNMILQNSNLLMNFNPFVNQFVQNINFNNNLNNPSNLLNNLNSNINPFNNSFYYQNSYQYFYQIFYNYWSDENNLLSSLKNILLNSHSSNYHSNINSINNKCEKLKEKYNYLKEIQKKNPSYIKEFTTLFEEKIILPVYTKINEENQIKKKVYTEVYNKYKNIILTVLTKHGMEDTQIEPYGSIVNNFMTEWGDIDICIIPKDNNLIQSFWEYLEEIKNEAVNVQKHAYFDLLERYPRFLILKMKDIEKNIDLDITVQNKLPILNTRLIRLYSLLDQRFHIFGIFLKFWVKKNHIHGALGKFLTSYALLILIIHYLQNITDPKILPILQQVENVKKEYKYHFEQKELTTNIYFEEDLEKISNYMSIINDKKENNSSVVELLIGFFEFYAYKYDHYLISISRSDKKPVAEDEMAAFPIEDPFDINYNPGKSMKLNTIHYSAFIYCMKKELNNILSGEYFKFGTGE